MPPVDTSHVDMDPGITPAQGRVLYHMERLFRSTGNAPPGAHEAFSASCLAEGLPRRIDTWDRDQCVLGLQLIERACRMHRMHLFRDCRTYWENLP